MENSSRFGSVNLVITSEMHLLIRDFESDV